MNSVITNCNKFVVNNERKNKLNTIRRWKFKVFLFAYFIIVLCNSTSSPGHNTNSSPTFWRMLIIADTNHLRLTVAWAVSVTFESLRPLKLSMENNNDNNKNVQLSFQKKTKKLIVFFFLETRKVTHRRVMRHANETLRILLYYVQIVSSYRCLQWSYCHLKSGQSFWPTLCLANIKPIKRILSQYWQYFQLKATF